MHARKFGIITGANAKKDRKRSRWTIFYLLTWLVLALGGISVFVQIAIPRNEAIEQEDVIETLSKSYNGDIYDSFRVASGHHKEALEGPSETKLRDLAEQNGARASRMGYDAEYLRYNYESSKLLADPSMVAIQIQNDQFDLNFTSYRSPRHLHLVDAFVDILKRVMVWHSFSRRALLMLNLDESKRAPLAMLGAVRLRREWTSLLPVPIYPSWADSLMDWRTQVRGMMESAKDYPWSSKLEKCVFRGNYSSQKFVPGSCLGHGAHCIPVDSWKMTQRGILYQLSESNPELLDVKFTGNVDETSMPNVSVVEPESLGHLQQFKYIVSAGEATEWDPNFSTLLHLNSVILKPETMETEWFTPVLVPGKHYVPVAPDYSDLIEKIQWAQTHEDQVQEIIRNANAFAAEYLKERAMLHYMYHTLTSFARKQDQVAHSSQ